MNFSKLNKIIKERKITQRELAQKTGLTQAGLNYILKKRDMKISLLEQIAEVLEVPVSYFFDEEGGVGISVRNGGGNVAIGNSKIVIDRQANEIEHLKKEIQMLREMLKQKDEMIALLKERGR